jgi:hypothetical protein
MKTTGQIHIAGSKTIDDWKAFRTTLAAGKEPAQWQEAFNIFFYSRLSLRYLSPIQVLQDNGAFQGEGFSILAIQCSLIEFLESTLQGISYRYRRKNDPPLTKYEYSDSGDIFVQFLTERKPFSQSFDKQSAMNFYINIRCGLLHEARTKGGWTVWAKSPNNSLISQREKIVYRDNFQEALLTFVDWYKNALPGDSALQQAFIRKFDSLCE